MGVVLPEPLFDDTNLDALDILSDGFCVAVDLNSGLSRVVTIFAGHRFKEQRVFRHRPGQWPGMIDCRIHAHDAGVGNEAPCRLNADDARQRRRDADRTGLIAAGRHVHLARRHERPGTGRRAARRVAHGTRIVHRAARAGRAAT